MPRRSFSDDGASAAMAASVASWKITYAGRLWARATSARQALSATKRSWPASVRLAATAGAALALVLRRRESAGSETDSRNCTAVSPLSTAREPSVSFSVLNAWPSTDKAPVAISWRSTPRNCTSLN
jgi:hypothetical protein